MPFTPFSSQKEVTGMNRENQSHKITSEHLQHKAFVYLRQSSLRQVRENLESQRLQYGLLDRARELGWHDIKPHARSLKSGSCHQLETCQRSLTALTPYALSFAAWFSFFYLIWGYFNPSTPYGKSRMNGFSFVHPSAIEYLPSSPGSCQAACVKV